MPTQEEQVKGSVSDPVIDTTVVSILPTQPMIEEIIKKFRSIVLSYETLEKTGHIEGGAVTENVNWDEVEEIIKEAYTKGFQDALEKVEKELKTIKQWVITAPYGLEFENGQAVERKREDIEYLKAHEVLDTLASLKDSLQVTK